ncbi:differentially expressed in FDCP 6-like isoform X2 [Ostrinia furnacalis]|uniref:differentially expressed in FDCP 6-like isoform X1 n=1 Tax=Ostrinia furnacalis TaxID=93504 RepID=UPI00103E9D97|nr:differentially expressed in FDCP 6-like isoform X1 [Ostrinia furnacalis]XP_028157421.1 differentially expressed in FDCP 6-like isoform X1 [Ostrinia furnacalis]XP_028157422.1 differentially expressed in FDCP 6-like isoform X2 [Ostrinia furnacalis]
MSALLKNVTNCIWYAFDSLQNNAVVHKSKLKVLTANIGTLLDLYGVEKGLDHFRSSQELTFDEFRYYLQHEVFSSLPKAVTLHIVREYEKKISEVCWLVCRKNLLGRDKPVFGDDSVFKLFRIFCLLADLVQDADDSKNHVIVLQPSEAGIVAEQLVHCLGLRWDAADWEALGSSIGHFKWAAFLAVLEAKYCCDQQIHSKALVEAVDEIYDVFIEDIIKKGYLFKRGYLLPTMREYWCVLQPCALTYYKSSSQKEQCGRISIDEYCSVEAAAGEGKLQRFQLITPDRTFEFGTQDHKSRLQWISALRQAAAVSGGAEGYQRRARAGRRGAGARREREVRETKARLQNEVRARLAAEAQAQELVEMAQQDNKKLEELKHTQAELEKLLQEETQAKRDEEIVRALQARVLAEEWERREELERLQEEQNRMLEEERLKRKQFEILQAEKEAQYREAEKRLKELELEKQRLDDELKAAQEKISKTEISKALHVHLRVRGKDMNPSIRNGERARRAISFVPTTKSSSDTLIDVRAIRHLKVVDDEEKI